jgi:hypothetical protein
VGVGEVTVAGTGWGITGGEVVTESSSTTFTPGSKMMVCPFFLAVSYSFAHWVLVSSFVPSGNWTTYVPLLGSILVTCSMVIFLHLSFVIVTNNYAYFI